MVQKIDYSQYFVCCYIPLAHIWFQPQHARVFCAHSDSYHHSSVLNTSCVFLCFFLKPWELSKGADENQSAGNLVSEGYLQPKCGRKQYLNAQSPIIFIKYSGRCYGKLRLHCLSYQPQKFHIFIFTFPHFLSPSSSFLFSLITSKINYQHWNSWLRLSFPVIKTKIVSFEILKFKEFLYTQSCYYFSLWFLCVGFCLWRPMLL